MSYNKMTKPPKHGQRVLDMLPHFAIPSDEVHRDNRAYWLAWRTGIVASGGSGVWRDYLTTMMLRDLEHGPLAIEAVTKLPAHLQNEIGFEVQVGYRRYISALAFTQMLRTTDLGETLFEARDSLVATGPRNVHGDGQGSRWYLHISSGIVHEYLPEYEPGVDKAWHEGPTTYVQVREPARPSPPFFEVHRAMLNGAEFDITTHTTLWPQLKTNYLSIDA